MSATTNERIEGLGVFMANVSALRVHHEEVFDVEADVLALTETRATAAGQRVLSSIAREKGWTPFWGPPLQSRGGGT